MCLCLLLLGCISPTFGQETPAEWAERLRQTQDASREDQADALRAFSRSGIAREHQSLREAATGALATQEPEHLRSSVEGIASALEVFARASAPVDTDANEAARRILSEPQFRKADEAPSNWLKRALDSLQPAEREEPEPRQLDLPTPTTVNLQPLFYGIIIVLAIGAGVALFLFARSWTGGRKSGAAKKKRKVGLLEEGEEALRTDEWLARADELERRGRFREAVRCLYLAVLMRLDDAGIVYFDRYQTNWEHLRRIEASNAPDSVGYRRLTQEFDHIWYGERPATAEHCAAFRSEYVRLTDALSAGTANVGSKGAGAR